MIKLTEREILMFENLAKVNEGKALADYLERLTTYICDIRNLGELSNAERVNISKILKDEVIDRLRLVNPERSKKNSEYI